MSGFRNILVGVDLTARGGEVCWDASAQSALQHARWLARESGARLTFLSVLSPTGDAAERPWRLTPSFTAAPSQHTVETPARRALANMVRQAQDEGIEPGAVLVPGKPAIEIMRQVLRDAHDLVVVGTHDPKGLRRILLGSTARRLLHDCPCPVWVSKQGQDTAPRRILVGSDLSQLSETAVRLGLSIGHLAQAHTHILDVVAFPLDRLWSPSPADPEVKSYHGRLRAETEQALRSQVRQNGRAMNSTVSVHVADSDGLPDHAIRQFIDDHHIDLLVLGTAARHGLSALLVGNTAERLLPEVPCSVVVVKPAGFVCPAELATV
jgi:universal stress protein E